MTNITNTCVIFHGMWQNPSTLDELSWAVAPFFDEVIVPEAPSPDGSWFTVPLAELLKSQLNGTVDFFEPMEQHLADSVPDISARLYQEGVTIDAQKQYTMIGFSQGATIASYLAFTLMRCKHLVLLDGLPVADLKIVQESSVWPYQITAVYPATLSEKQLSLWYNFKDQATRQGCDVVGLRSSSMEHAVTEETIALVVERILGLS